jgi:hypothetical protein
MVTNPKSIVLKRYPFYKIISVKELSNRWLVACDFKNGEKAIGALYTVDKKSEEIKDVSPFSDPEVCQAIFLDGCDKNAK